MHPELSIEQAVEKLSKAIKIPTISDPSIQDYHPFDNFITFLESSYPHCHAVLEQSRINNYALVYRMKGKNRDADPLLFISHYDVLPASIDSTDWTYPPFDGVIVDGKIHGRGSTTGKFQIIALLEAIERFISKGIQPERDIYLAFGFDRYSGGNLGAARIASFFKNQHLHFAGILCDGIPCLQNLSFPTSGCLAYISVSERKTVRLRLTLHSTQQLKDPLTALCTVPTALISQPLPQRLTPVALAFANKLSADLSGRQRYIFEHANLLKPAFFKQIARICYATALTSSEIVPTQISSTGFPGFSAHTASLCLTCHLLPGESVETLIEHIHRTCPELPLRIDVISNSDTSSISSFDNMVYEHLKACISVVFPEAETVPFILPESSDARHYQSLSDCIYRFSPYISKPQNIPSDPYHYDECISFDNLARAIDFYTTFIQNFT